MPNRLLRGVHRVEDWLLAGLLLGLLVLQLVQIGMRIFFHSGLEWAEPVGRLGLLWLALGGALGATRAHRHIGIDALPRILPPKWHRAAWMLTQLVTAGICAVLAWFGWGMVGMEREVPADFIPGVPSWWPMLAFPAAFALMSLRFVIAAFAEPPEPGANG